MNRERTSNEENHYRTTINNDVFKQGVVTPRIRTTTEIETTTTYANATSEMKLSVDKIKEIFINYPLTFIFIFMLAATIIFSVLACLIFCLLTKKKNSKRRDQSEKYIIQKLRKKKKQLIFLTGK